MRKEVLGGVIFLGLALFCFFWGGLGYRYMVVGDMGIFAGLILSILAWVLNKHRLELPRYFWLYMGFSALVGWDVLTRSNPFYSPQFFSMLVGGGFFWTAFYLVGRSKSGDIVGRYLPTSLVWLGYLFTVLFVINRTGALDQYELFFGFIQPITTEHIHLGVYWSVLMILVLPKLGKQGKYPWQIVIPSVLGLYLMFLSQARSSFLGLMVGFMVYYQNEILAKTKQGRLIRVVVGLMIVAMVGITTYKPIRSFHFFTPAILNLVREPLGSGIGQFEKVTSYYAYLYGSGDFVTASTHNLFLEMTVGLGWIGMIYVLWTGLSVYASWKHKKGKRNLYLALYLAILSIFMVDPAYGIPTMTWLWMSFLGLAQSDWERGRQVDLQT